VELPVPLLEPQGVVWSLLYTSWLEPSRAVRSHTELPGPEEEKKKDETKI